MRLAKLPAWIVPNDVSVEREVADYRDMPLDEKLRITKQLCREAAIVIAAAPDAKRLWDWTDPLPDSTIALFRRLGMGAPGMPR
jgi:hypothetical protein